MAHIRRQIDLASSPDAVFALLTDLVRMPEWATIVVDSRDVSDKALSAGCIFRQTIGLMGRELDTEWRVTEFEPARRQVASWVTCSTRPVWKPTTNAKRNDRCRS